MPVFERILRNARVVDPAHATDSTLDLGVANGTIVASEPQLDEADAAEVVDLRDCVAIPGIIDTHVHVGGFGARSRAVGHHMVAETGVTTVLDMGSRMETIIDGIRDRGAGLNVAALLSSAAAFGDASAPSADDIGAAIDQEMERGAFGLKIIGGHTPLTPDATARAIEVANGRGAYVAYHIGTTASSSNMHGVRELPELLGSDGRVHVAHVAAYCRGMVDSPLRECAETLDILSALRGRVVSESYLSTKHGFGNATSGACRGDDVSDFVTRNCLAMGGYLPTRSDLRRAMVDGYCGVTVERGGRMILLSGAEAADAWEAAGSEIGVSFPVTPPETAAALTLARDDEGFIVDALATDGGAIPRNWMVERGLALVRAGGLSMDEYVRKVSYNPARMLGLSNKGHLGVGADADITVLDLTTGSATMSFARGRPIMIAGQVVGSSGTLLVPPQGVAHASASGLAHEMVDPAAAAMYRL